jgi:hypothetical protein
MKYLCLAYCREADLEERSEEEYVAQVAEHLAYDDALRESGRCLGAEGLEYVRTAATVRVRQGRTTVTDGPFAETKEQLAGFYLIEARDLNEAIQIASGIPTARFGSVEVRPVRDCRGLVANAAR